MSDPEERELPPLRLRRRRRLLPELELDVHRPQRRRDEPPAMPDPLPADVADVDPPPPASGSSRRAEPAAPVAVPAEPVEAQRADDDAAPAVVPETEPLAAPEPRPDVAGGPPKWVTSAAPQADPVPSRRRGGEDDRPGEGRQGSADREPGEQLAERPPRSRQRLGRHRPEAAADPAPPPAPPPPTQAAPGRPQDHLPLYWRALRLHHVRPNGWQRALLLEGAIAVGIVLVLAGVATVWTILALPVVAAIVVKLHDVLVGGLSGEADGRAGAPPAGAGGDGAKPVPSGRRARVSQE